MGVLAAEVAVRVSPELFPWFALAGLVYPLSLASLLLGFAWRLLAARWRGIWFPLLVLFATISHLNLHWGGGGETTVEDDLRLLTWNVRQFDRYGQLQGETTRDAVLDQIRAMGADVVCLQEAYEHRGSPPFVNAKMIQAATGLKNVHSFFEQDTRKRESFGVMTLTRLPIVGRSRLRFDEDPGNGAVITDVLFEGDTVRIINAHLSSIGLGKSEIDAVRDGPDRASSQRLWSRLSNAWKKRANQAHRVASEVTSSPYPVVLCGDFNDPPMSYALEVLRAAHLSDSFAEAGTGFGGTYIGDLPSLRIDYVLHDSMFEAVRVEVGEEEFSDHRSVLATLRKVR
jgi:endonuclease/exonuclease/phosphatase family metal-dependent hydrolase